MIFAISDTRPNRLIDKKDTDYHLRWGRFAFMAGYNHPAHQVWLNRTLINEMFYQGDQWRTSEDVEIFLKDSTGDTRNRIQVTLNMIRKLVEGYRGNAETMKLGATARSVSPLSITRKEKKLGEMIFMTEIAMKMPEFADTMKKRYPIGSSKAETEEIFENVYVDNFVKGLNDLLEYVSELNEFENNVPRLAEHLALSGLCGQFNYLQSGHQRFDVLQSKDFFFDRNARRYDLQDAAYMGHIEYLSPAQIYEMSPGLSFEQMKALETYDQRNFPGQSTGFIGRFVRTGVPVINVYWRDTEPIKVGYIVNEFGDTLLKRLDYTYPGEDIPRYTEIDVVDPPKTEEAKKTMGGKKIKRIFPDVIRYIKYVPFQSVPDPANKKSMPDLTLEHGEMPYQEVDINNFNVSPFPYKMGCWSYINGEIHSPVDDAINPQRFINRVLSVVDSQVRQSGGAGVVLDRSAFSTKDEERDAVQAMQEGKPVFADLRGRGVQNMVSTYDTTPKSGTYSLFNLVSALKDVIQTTTGQNEAMQGEQGSADQLVGVTRAMIQQGSLLQEPVYSAIRRVMLQSYQAIATRGKRMYIDNETQLITSVGDDGARAISLSKEMNAEEFRVFVRLDADHDALVNSGNAMLLALRQQGLLDDTYVANLFGRATPQEVANAIRQYAKDKIEIGRAMQEQQQQQAMQQAEATQTMVQMQRDSQQQQRQYDDNVRNEKQVDKLEQIQTKAAVNNIYNPKTSK